MRAETTTVKKIRPDQLKEELGGADIFTSEGGRVQAEGVTKGQLEAALAAHVPVFDEPPLASDEIKALRALLRRQ